MSAQPHGYEKFREPILGPDANASALGSGSLDIEVRAVLTLAAGGLTDREIARELGMSLRTVSRRVEIALIGWDVATRFHLGVLVGRQLSDCERTP